MPLDVTDKPQCHPNARRVLDTNDRRGQPKRLILTRKVQIQLRLRARCHGPRSTHEQPVARHVFDQPIDDDAIDFELSARSDRDSNCCPLVHVVKATLATHHPESNPF
jgi:hypothetical protein